MNLNSRLVYIILGVVVILLLVTCFGVYHKFDSSEGHYSFADLGLPTLTLPDCSKIDNSNTNYPVSISFSVSDVSSMRDKIKVLSDKYKGQITSDSFTSYPITPIPQVGNTKNQITSISQDNANLTIILSNSEQSFISELNALIKGTGGINSSYSSQNSPSYASSPVSSCQTYLQNVSADKTQLEILTRALAKERNPQTISLISQVISTAHTGAQNDINALNDFFKNTNNPTITISITSISR